MIFKRLIIGISQIITLVTMVTKVRRVIYTLKVANLQRFPNLRTFVPTLFIIYAKGIYVCTVISVH